MQKYAIPLALLSGTLLLMFMTLTEPAPQQIPPPKKGMRYGEMEKISSDSAKEIQINYQMTELKNMANPGIEPKSDANQEHIPNVVNMQPSSAAFDAEDNAESQAPTLDAKMEKFMAEREKFEEMETIKRQEYVELFKQRAARMGYEVEINNEMEIVKIRKTGGR